MDRAIKLGVMALIAAVAILALLALGASADPANVNNPPSEDWIFNESKTITIASKTWKVRYNITVTNASKLIIDKCKWTFNGTDPWRPIWILWGIGLPI